LILLLPCAAMARQAQPAADEGFQSLDEWMQDNINPDVVKALKQLDQDRVQRIFSELQLAMQGTNLYQLGTLRETASQLAPLLQKYEATTPYGVWLQSRLDYLDAAEKLQREMKSSLPKSGVAVLSPGPPLKLQRQVWVRELAQRPWPPLAQTYVPGLKQVFVSENMPPELVWVAEVESSFDPRARSPAGAAGMFQLMPQTARAGQLSLWPWDERLQPEKSARAAAIYLRQLHHHYGDWQLALAAYNIGEARIDKLLKQHKAHNFDAIARWLPAETQMYVPKVEATIHKREGRALTDLKIPKA
jgi:peptidoglycan lytic transglycosylase D